MANRPSFLDLRSRSHGPVGAALPSPRGSPRGLPSPRLHIAGDVPPDLSPLDAFAAQSRMLAKQLEDSISEGKRISRLTPLMIESHLGPRPGAVRSASAEPPMGVFQSHHDGSGHNAEVENPGYRPVSVHPQLSGIAGPPAIGLHRPASRLQTHEENEEEPFRGRRPPSGHGHPDFGAPRQQSPPALEQPNRADLWSGMNPKPSVESMRQRAQGQRRPQEISLGKSGFNSRALAPPRSPFAQRTPSPRSVVSNDSSDDDYKNLNQSSLLERSFSAGSGFSTSPISSPTAHFMARSPSISSEISVGGTQLPRPAFNFSRPISRASMTGLTGFPNEMPSRQASSDSQPSFILADDTAHTPVSMHSEGFPDTDGAVQSYVYSRFSLPRGKTLQRNSMIFQDSPQAQHSWDQPPTPFANAHSFNGSAPPSPPSRPSTSYRPSVEPGRPSLEPARPSTSSASHFRPSLDPGRPSVEHGFDFSRPSLDPGTPVYDSSKSSMDRGQNALPTEWGRPSTEQGVPMPPSPSVASSGTIKAKSQHSLAPTAEWTSEDHVTKAIEYHEAGALTKSTYHLRLAARQNHPTGMLLYALACRHGWGMRPNQKEGVQWLRKAADCAGLEVADDEDLIKDGKTVDYLERKARKAQFALSIYELGVSHMNGWGIDQDKILALRCFEIAGTWGDADALAEAGFCYAQGMGCKKDLKKAASFYRQAETKGISMVGNSWIYKAKYNDDPATQTSKPPPSRSGTGSTTKSSPEKEKKPRDKSRTRTIFGRKIKN